MNPCKIIATTRWKCLYGLPLIKCNVYSQICSMLLLAINTVTDDNWLMIIVLQVSTKYVFVSVTSAENTEKWVELVEFNVPLDT